MVNRLLVFAFGVMVYAVFLASVVYGIGFVGNVFVPKGIDGGLLSSLPTTVVIDLMLVALFGAQHSIMARPAFKRAWLQIVPVSLERSIFVLASSLSLLVLFWQWHPIVTTVWDFPQGFARVALTAVFYLGWCGVVASTFLINHFDLFGLRQVYLHLRERPYTPVPFKQPWIYRMIRHPLMTSFLVAFWATPHMSGGHLLFALAMSAVIIIGTILEERDLVTLHGDEYRRYRQQVSMFIPWRHKP